MEYDDEEGEIIDWESPFDDVRSSEVNDITLEFLDSGRKVTRVDDKGEEYILFKFNTIRQDISNPKDIAYSTSSKGLIEAMGLYQPIKGKTLQIIKSGSGFQTKYSIKEL